MTDLTQMARAITQSWKNTEYGDNLSGWWGIECIYCNASAQQNDLDTFDMPTKLDHEADCIIHIAEKHDE